MFTHLYNALISMLSKYDSTDEKCLMQLASRWKRRRDRYYNSEAEYDTDRNYLELRSWNFPKICRKKRISFSFSISFCQKLKFKFESRQNRKNWNFLEFKINLALLLILSTHRLVNVSSNILNCGISRLMYEQTSQEFVRFFLLRISGVWSGKHGF